MIPLSYAQRRLWFIDRLEGPSATYNVPVVLRLTGELDVPALRTALADVVARHESLRTLFPEQDGNPYQLILDADRAAPDLEPVRTTEAFLARRVQDASRYVFDLSAEIPLHARLFAVGEREHVLLVVMHHIVSDGWSLGPLLRDLAEAYTARIAGGAPQWDELEIQYADYTLWQQELLADEEDPESVAGSQFAYWKEQLADLPEELPLPLDRPRPGVPSFTGDAVLTSAGAELHGRLLQLARSERATLFMLMQAAFSVVLSRFGAGEDIPVGTPVAGRGDDALDDLVGFFVNTLVLRTDTSGDPSFRELLGRVRDGDLVAFEHQDIPFDRLVEVLNPVRSAARHPLFQVMLVLQNNAQATLALPGLDVRAENTSTGAAKFDLTAAVRERYEEGRPAGLDLTLEYAKDLFDRSTAERLLDATVRLLAAVADAPDLPIGRHRILSEDELLQLLVHWNDTAAEYADDRCVHELFEEQVVRTPDAVALVFEGTRVTYRELNARANRLARHLADRGVGRGSVVGVFLERGIELVVATLAVLKAGGGGYTQLDPKFPTDRLTAVLGEIRAEAVVTCDALAERLVESGARLRYVRVDGEADLIAALDASNPGVRVSVEDVACVMFTSGSTG
ncbi:condensation domain-containing protein, partial [Kitasatospora sp. NPDC088346]|uniref:condensation domain-containing protein n=1 Tax=Kitasatospora sp. NPDC088346 TaxID=3364073 RepID=UPI00381D3590